MANQQGCRAWVHVPMIHSWTKHWTKHYWSLPVNALCEAHIGNAGSIVSQQVNVRVQDTCVHWLAVLWQHWNTGVLMRYTLYTTNKTRTHSTDNCVDHWHHTYQSFTHTYYSIYVSINYMQGLKGSLMKYFYTCFCDNEKSLLTGPERKKAPTDVENRWQMWWKRVTGKSRKQVATILLQIRKVASEVQTTDVWHDPFQIFWKQILQHWSGIFEDKYTGSSDGKPARTNFN